MRDNKSNTLSARENEYSLLEKYYMHMNTYILLPKEQAGTTKSVCPFCSVCLFL